MRSFLRWLIVLSAWATPILGQTAHLRVAVAITDSETNGLYTSAFSSAFRSLGDVDVVSLAESPQYVLEGVVVCLPDDCENAQSYTLSLRLYSPFDTAFAHVVALLLVTPLPEATYQARADSAASVLSSAYVRYEETHETWSVAWGRLKYEQGVLSLVREIDAQCLDKARISNRLFATPHANSLQTLSSALAPKKWIC